MLALPGSAARSLSLWAVSEVSELGNLMIFLAFLEFFKGLHAL